MNSNEKGAITKGHQQDSILTSSKQVTTVISDEVDTIYSSDEPVSSLSSKLAEGAHDYENADKSKD